MRMARKLVIVVAVLAIIVVPMLADAQRMGYRPVTDQRLAEPEPANWLMTRGNYQGWSYSPLVAKGKVMVGVSGGEFGVRGFVAAFDANSGQPTWKTYTVPAPGEKGSETWTGDTWKKGGGSVWITGTYDPALNLTYWGTGNASPWFGDQRPGDNLYTSSTVAINPDTGKLAAHFQYHWNDAGDCA